MAEQQTIAYVSYAELVENASTRKQPKPDTEPKTGASEDAAGRRN